MSARPGPCGGRSAMTVPTAIDNQQGRVSLLPGTNGTIKAMKQHDDARHPGPMRVMRVDAEFAGIIVAVGFLVLGAVGLDIGKWFVLGALVLGAVVALLMRFTRKE